MNVLDHVFHTKVYQTVTEVGPLKIPTGLEKAAENAVKLIKDVTSIAAQTVGFISGKGQETAILSGQIENFHAPTQRNWTRAINGVLQGIVLTIISIFIKKNFKIPFILFSISWSAVGVRHLTSVGYSEPLHRYYQQNTKMFWK